MKLPRHAGGLYITGNDHLSDYMTARERIEQREESFEFPDDAERDKAIATNSIYVVRWYPDTPIGFYEVVAATLEAALEFALIVDERALAENEPGRKG